MQHALAKMGQGIRTGRVKCNAKQYFGNVCEMVWNFHISGYQVAEKWLKDRKGRKLSADDIAHSQRVLIALHETMKRTREIDNVIGEFPME